MQRIFQKLRAVAFSLLLITTILVSPQASAADVYSGPMVGFLMSPVNQVLKLSPGDTYDGTYYLMNPEQNTATVNYVLTIQGFYRDNDGKAVFENVDGRSQIASWITLKSPEKGSLAPGASVEVKYSIKVPNDVPGGGQYASITASSVTDDSANPGSTTIKESVAMAYTIYAEIAGETRHSGTITDMKIPGFLTDGNITASAVVTNSGNVHDTASYSIKVYPLFSSQPAYTNESEPDQKLVLPDRSVFQETAWSETPAIGIFHVVYTVSFGDFTTETTEQLVIKCPVWLLLIILILIAGLVILIAFWLRRRHFAANSRVKEVLN